MKAARPALRIPPPKPPNQNKLIAQVVTLLNHNGFLAWRQENNGRIDEATAVEKLTELLIALAHVNYKADKVAPLIRKILHECYRPVPSSLKGVSDILGINLATGQFLVIEIKCGADVIRPDQEVFLKTMRDAGAEVWLCRDFESWKTGFWKKHPRQVQAEASHG